MPWQYIAAKYAKILGKERFDGADYPVFALGAFGYPFMSIQDPDVVQELFSTKNKFIDKDGTTLKMFEKLAGDSFLFAYGDETWKMKRKACAHAFYKDRLTLMVNTLKHKI